MSHVFWKGGYNILMGAKSIPRNIFLGFPKGNGDGPHAFQDTHMVNDVLTPPYSIDTVTAQDLANLTLEAH